MKADFQERDLPDIPDDRLDTVKFDPPNVYIGMQQYWLTDQAGINRSGFVEHVTRSNDRNSYILMEQTKPKKVDVTVGLEYAVANDQKKAKILLGWCALQTFPNELMSENQSVR